MPRQPSDSRCDTATEALIDSLRTGLPVDPPIREHLRHCSTCSALIERMKVLEGELATPESNAAHDELAEGEINTEVETLARQRRRRRLGLGLGAGLVLVVLLVTMIAASERSSTSETALLIILMLSLFIVLPVLLVVGARAALQRGGEPPVYKRLRPGRLLSGVCLGLAERLKIPVLVMRIIFLGLFFVDGAGLLLYIVLDLILPVHPDDRQYLLRFRLRRWWSSRTKQSDAV